MKGMDLNSTLSNNHAPFIKRRVENMRLIFAFTLSLYVVMTFTSKTLLINNLLQQMNYGRILTEIVRGNRYRFFSVAFCMIVRFSSLYHNEIPPVIKQYIHFFNVQNGYDSEISLFSIPWNMFKDIIFKKIKRMHK